MKFLNTQVYGNRLDLWLLAIAIAIVTYIALKLIRRFIARRLTSVAKRTRTTVDDLTIDLLKNTRGFFLLALSIYAGSLVLALSGPAGRVISSLVVVALLIQVALWGNRLISYLIKTYTEKRLEEDAATATTVSALGFIGRLVLWSVIVLMALENMGIDITALVAGLGVGGIAVALAVQNILGDLFASLSIVLDKPFVIGDFIIIGDYMGTVEHIGLKTTRIRSLSGEQLVFSNTDLLQSRVRNFKRMYERRVLFTIGVIYQTPYEKLQKIPQIIREIIEKQHPVRFDRAHFKSFGDFSLNYEIVYWVQDPDYNVYMDIQQAINLEIYRRFAEEGIEFAYPTQSIFVEKLPTPSANVQPLS